MVAASELTAAVTNSSKISPKSPKNLILHFLHVSRNSVRSEPCLSRSLSAILQVPQTQVRVKSSYQTRIQS